MHHHFITPNARWGVSSPFWDYIFGTLEESRDSDQTKEAKRL
jgi:sterol desaturase/sphingolipid hydroxylase (fatty acid hydroxylase superfamily)